MGSEDTPRTYLITGANQGLGFDAARQLAILPETRKVYLACRAEPKAVTAIETLVKDHGISREKLEFVLFDASDSKESIGLKLSLPQDERFDSILFNAGGMGHDSSGKPIPPNQVLDMYQINLLGHIHLLEVLTPYLIPQKTRIVFSGSEMARGVPSMGSPAPTLPDTVDGYKGMLQGTTPNETFDGPQVYGRVKALSALYWASWARRNPDYYIVTVSPGFTRGTSFGTHKNLPFMARALYPALLAITGLLGTSQSLEQGAKIYVDAMTGKDIFAQTISGSFVAAANGKPVGPLSDDQGLIFKDASAQDMAYEAVPAKIILNG